MSSAVFGSRNILKSLQMPKLNNIIFVNKRHAVGLNSVLRIYSKLNADSSIPFETEMVQSIVNACVSDIIDRKSAHSLCKYVD